MSFGLGFIQLMTDDRHRQKWGLTGPMQQDTDATIIVGDVAVPVHRMILAAKAPKCCNWTDGKAGKREINVSGVDIHTVWRMLELIYCQTYTSGCPKTHLPDDKHELIKHASVYQLCDNWGISKSLQDIPFAKFQTMFKDTKSYEDVFRVWKTALAPYSHDASVKLPVWKIREDRIIRLILQKLSEDQSVFQERFLELSLVNPAAARELL